MYQYLDLGNHVIIPIYNLMIGIGIIFGVLVLDYRVKRNNINHIIEIDLYCAVILSIIIGFFGAKIFDLYYKQQTISIANLLNSGMTYYGGFIFGIIIFSVYVLIRKRSLFYMLNFVIPSMILVHAFGRIGCFLCGCCFGKPTDSFLGVFFPDNSIPFHYYERHVRVYPTQLFESFFLFTLFVVIIKIIPFRLRLTAYLIFYGLFRFFIEYLRGDYRGKLFIKFMSPSQIISIIFVVLGLILYIILKNIKIKKNRRHPWRRLRKGFLLRLTGLFTLRRQ